MKIPGEIEVDSGKATIRETQAGTDVMTALKDFLEQNPGVTKLQIEGHTDNQALKDKTMTNQKNTPETAAKATCCNTCDCGACSCGCPKNACRCAATKCACGCRAASRR